MRVNVMHSPTVYRGTYAYLIEAFRGRMRLDTTESLHKVDLYLLR